MFVLLISVDQCKWLKKDFSSFTGTVSTCEFNQRIPYHLQHSNTCCTYLQVYIKSKVSMEVLHF